MEPYCIFIFYFWLLSLNIMFLRFYHIVVYSWIHGVALLYNIQFCEFTIIYIFFLLFYGKLGSFQFFTVTKNAAVNIMYIYFCVCIHNSFSYIHNRWIAAPLHIFIIARNCQFSKVVLSIYIHKLYMRVLIDQHSHQHLAFFSNFGFNWMFPMTNEV